MSLVCHVLAVSLAAPGACLDEAPDPEKAPLLEPAPTVVPQVTMTQSQIYSPVDLRELGLTSTRDPLNASTTNSGLLGTFSAKQTIRDGEVGTVWDDPLTKKGWQADQDWKLGLLGPVFVFTQTSAAAEEALQQDAKLSGRSGLALQVPVPVGELLLRGGTNVSFTDPFRQDRVKERSEMLLEVKAKYPLLFGLNLEIQGTASPALSPLDRDWVSQEVRLALPLGGNGQFHLGARQRWDNVVEQKTISDGPQLFLGFEIKH
jgi:hypothetical protein